VVKVDRLVTHRFPLDRIQEAFAAHRSPESIKGHRRHLSHPVQRGSGSKG